MRRLGHFQCVLATRADRLAVARSDDCRDILLARTAPHESALEASALPVARLPC